MFPDFAVVVAEPPAEVGRQSPPARDTSVPSEAGPTRFNLEIPLAHTGALLFGMRATETALWPKPFAYITTRSWWEHYREAFTRPPLFDSDARAFEWDHDRWTLNVFGHGLLGSELYFRPRRCGASPLAALAFAAGASVAWEYAFEGNGVRPSALDLVYTPLAGLVLGEGRYWGVRLARGIGNRPLRATLSTLLDPLGEFERGLGAEC
ncbi:MAG TPA: DUF3943 domain-containing protein [Polyangiaceae bacterium]|nr:DUF3943 domain-containing protein [Polyangiaceae bacterium]